MNKSLHEQLSEYLLRPITDINKKDLKKFSKSKLIKMLLRPIVNVPDLNLDEYMKSLSKCGAYGELKKRKKSEIIRLLLDKEKNRPEIQINYKDTTYEIKEHIPGSKLTMKYTGYLFTELMNKLILNQDIQFVCDTLITAC